MKPFAFSYFVLCVTTTLIVGNADSRAESDSAERATQDDPGVTTDNEFNAMLTELPEGWHTTDHQSFNKVHLFGVSGPSGLLTLTYDEDGSEFQSSAERLNILIDKGADDEFTRVTENIEDSVNISARQYDGASAIVSWSSGTGEVHRRIQCISIQLSRGALYIDVWYAGMSDHDPAIQQVLQNINLPIK